MGVTVSSNAAIGFACILLIRVCFIVRLSTINESKILGIYLAHKLDGLYEHRLAQQSALMMGTSSGIVGTSAPWVPGTTCIVHVIQLCSQHGTTLDDTFSLKRVFSQSYMYVLITLLCAQIVYPRLSIIGQYNRHCIPYCRSPPLLPPLQHIFTHGNKGCVYISRHHTLG